MASLTRIFLYFTLTMLILFKHQRASLIISIRLCLMKKAQKNADPRIKAFTWLDSIFCSHFRVKLSLRQIPIKKNLLTEAWTDFQLRKLNWEHRIVISDERLAMRWSWTKDFNYRSEVFHCVMKNKAILIKLA